MGIEIEGHGLGPPERGERGRRRKHRLCTAIVCHAADLALVGRESVPPHGLGRRWPRARRLPTTLRPITETRSREGSDDPARDAGTDQGALPGGTRTPPGSRSAPPAAMADGAMSCSVDLGRALYAAGAHPGVGGSGSAACSGDLLLGALAACAQLTCQMVAANMGLDGVGVSVTVEGDLDLRGTLGTADVPVGFKAIRVRFALSGDVPAGPPREAQGAHRALLRRAPDAPRAADRGGELERRLTVSRARRPAARPRPAGSRRPASPGRGGRGGRPGTAVWPCRTGTAPARHRARR